MKRCKLFTVIVVTVVMCSPVLAQSSLNQEDSVRVHVRSKLVDLVTDCLNESMESAGAITESDKPFWLISVVVDEAAGPNQISLAATVSIASESKEGEFEPLGGEWRYEVPLVSLEKTCQRLGSSIAGLIDARKAGVGPR